MPHNARARRFLPLAALLPVLGGLIPQDPPSRLPPPAQETTAPIPRTGEYFGTDGCVDCHEAQRDLIVQGVHREVVGPELWGCETCHGPGEAHGLDLDNDPQLITHPPTLAPAAQFAFCGICHREQLEGHGGDPQGFLQAGKGCTACHQVHEAAPALREPALWFATRAECAAKAEDIGAKACVECHPLRNELLGKSVHSSLALGQNPQGCETCHGAGSLHAESDGIARLITRPDRATDGMQTCRSCHDQVDPVEFHWVDRHQPLLTKDATCTTCHTVHRAEPPAPRVDGVTGQSTARSPLRAPPAPTNQVCLRCHVPAFDVLPGTVHDQLGRLETPLAEGCAACHAGAEQHAAGPGRRDLVESMHGTSAALQLETCGKCHSDDLALRHVEAGYHYRSEVSCLSCHSPAAPRGRVQQDAEQKCQSCHPSVAAEFRQPNRHPVPEGHMGCADCHEPHGARFRFRDLELRQGRCVTCHREYRGPYVFAHQASRVDGCVVCHFPHGSSNNRMLRQATTQQNCLQCHADFPALHDQTPGSVFTNCLNCHTEVHGSNFDRLFHR